MATKKAKKTAPKKLTKKVAKKATKRAVKKSRLPPMGALRRRRADAPFEKVEPLTPAESAGHLVKPEAPSNLTEAEHQRLRDCPTMGEYETIALDIKAAHGGYYPIDWYPSVLSEGGYLSAIRAREGKTNEPLMTVS